MNDDGSVVEMAGDALVWAFVFEERMRNIVRRPYAVIDGRVMPINDVVCHCPEAMQ